VLTARKVWFRRNEVVHGGTLTHPTSLMTEAQKALEDFQRATVATHTDDTQSRSVGVERWKPPPESMLKINWDAAVDSRRGIVGLGILVRDVGGRVKAACIMTKKMVASAPDAEALAALHAVILANEGKYTGVIFEGDALIVVNALNSPNYCESTYGHYVEGMKQGLCCLGVSKFVHVKREANMAAHTLARAACNHATGSILWHCTPSCIDGIIGKEIPPPYL
jgi:ribonuclease HI